MQMMLQAWEYGDPEKVAERREAEEQAREKNCGKCIHRVSVQFDGNEINRCGIKKRIYGIRCQSFKKVTKGEKP